MAGPQTTVTQKAAREIGNRFVKLMIQRSGSRTAGHILKNDRVWQKAYKHIAEHFTAGAGASKAAHAVFDKALCNEKALRELVRQTATKSSRAPVVSKVTIGGIPSGQPVVIIERAFTKVIGTAADGQPAKILRLVVDYTGKPLTAFPVSCFFGAAAAKGTTAMAAATAALIMTAVQDAYAAEAAANENRLKSYCEPQSVMDWILDILLSPSCIAPDPPDLTTISRRVNEVIRRIEEKTGVALDPRTRESIREDVQRIWGW